MSTERPAAATLATPRPGSAPTTLTVFGATGGTGRLVIDRAVEAGHEVRAVVRRPATPLPAHPNLRIHRADLFDPEALKPALDGADAVVSALGPAGRKDTSEVCARGIRSILTAMAATGVQRIVVVSAQPVLRSGAGEPFWFRRTVTPVVRAVYRRVYADLAQMERILADSSVAWTVLRPPYLTDDTGTGTYRSALDANVTGSSLSRADLASALLDVVHDPASVGHGVGIAGG